MTNTVYAASRIKRLRRTKAEMGSFYDALLDVVAEQQPMTVRQVFYQAEVRGLVEKAESGYEKVQRALVLLRTAKRLPFSWLVDNTRWQRKPITYDSTEEMLAAAAASYRRAVWSGLDQRLEIWIEKDALAGVVVPVTAEYDVPLLSMRGYSSVSFAYSAAEAITAAAQEGITTWVYHLGDFDPSGQDAARALRATLTEYTPSGAFEFESLALTEEQIERFQLPARPTKQSDTRAKRFGRRFSVELDALSPDVLRALVRDTIEEHLPAGYMDSVRLVEEEERRGFVRLMALVEGDVIG